MFRNLYRPFLICVMTFAVSSSISSKTTNPYYQQETVLKKALLGAVDKDIRPSIDKSTPVSIDFEFSPVKINGLDEREHTLDMTYFLYMTWKDPRLSWNTSTSTVDQLRILIDEIWHPDLSLFNIDRQQYMHTYGDMAIVQNDGQIKWLPAVTTQSWCHLNLYRFPFDTQVCVLVFGSWVFPSSHVRFHIKDERPKKGEDLPDYFGSGMEIEWKLMELTQTVQLINYTTGIPEWSEISVTVKLRRLGKYYQSVFVAPIVLLAFLSPLVFLLPPDSTAKSTLGSMIILAECVLLINLQVLVQPAHYQIPRLVMFYISTFVLTSMSLFASTVVCNIAKKGSRRRGVPAWLSTIFLGRCGLRKVLCVETYSPVQRFDALVSMREDANIISDVDDFGTEMTGPSQNPVERELREIRKILQVLTGRYSNDENYNSLTREWFEISRVLDRLLLVVFYAILTLTAVAFLL